ncbi:ATPase associated with various cellular activities (AAA) family protein [Candida albicans]|uniref:ATPase associated with various cellular activities (AAA) family protein n=1 Tax=Candida albicans TaxID=5476 RepID=A0A8H6BUT9_CANAX|nr:ATPase associated with various cellular activities (AAA) family protein [Candida albicans]
MSSKSSSKKKNNGVSTPESSTAPAKKIKIPKSFIVRPNVPTNNKSVANVYINPEILSAMELNNGNLVLVSSSDSGSAGVVATVYSSNDIVDKNVITISFPYRQLCGLLLGDRVELVKFMNQPQYASDISISGVEETVTEDVRSALLDIGLVYPGLQINVDNKRITIVDVNDSLDASMDKLSIKDSDSLLSVHTYPNLPQQITYDQVGGLSKQIELLKSTIELPLNNPTLFSDFGISPPRGILLHGPPGTGKTMLLRCVANSITEAHVLTINGPSIVSKYLGETENAIRDIFNEAKKFQPSIIFMDEIDSIAPSRTSDDSGETESRVVAQLLTVMDGMGDNGRIVVIGATNRPNSIDSALRRPGRFDQEVEIGIPDVEAREEILTKQFAKMNSEKCQITKEEIASIASKTHGYVGADLTALCRESVMKAINRGLTVGIPQTAIKVTVDDVYHALPEIRPSAMREIFLEMPKVHWSDIGGQEELKRKLIEVVQLPLEASDSFKNLGVSSPKGVLLYGPPGCSKTLTAKALATESGLNFLAVKGPEIFNKYVGESERAIREIFRKARAASPSIIFFDEIDAIAGDRDGDSSTTAASNVLTSLLNEIDGVEELKGVVIVGATNKPTEIDPALLRPGRLDRHIYVAPPDYDARLQILQKCSRKFNLQSGDESVDLQKLAELTDGCSGAEVTLLCQEAGLAAIMENKEATTVTNKHFEHALKGISRGITPEMLEYYEKFSKKSGLNI